MLGVAGGEEGAARDRIRRSVRRARGRRPRDGGGFHGAVVSKVRVSQRQAREEGFVLRRRRAIRVRGRQ